VKILTASGYTPVAVFTPRPTAELSPTPSRPALHGLALLTVCLTFPLIFLGGLVTSHQAGLSVPDWPNSYGYNMFLFPPRLWIGGIRYEHTHRLLGSAVGFCAVMLTLCAWGPARTGRGRRWVAMTTVTLLMLNALGTSAMIVWPGAFHLPEAARTVGNIAQQGGVTALGIALCGSIAFFCRRREPRRWVRWLASACLLAVCFQGLLGGLRVDLVNLPLAIAHGCFAQATFCLMVLTAIVTGRWWLNAPNLSAANDAVAGRRLAGIAIGTVCVIYAQLIVGAMMRHEQAGLAIPGVLIYGHLLPPTTVAGLAAANTQRAWQYHLAPVTLGQMWLHFGHRIGAAAVSGMVLLLCGTVLSRFRQMRSLTRPALLLLVLLATQLTLGVLTVYYRKPADIASTHVAVGALVLVTALLVAVRTLRVYSLARRGGAAVGASENAVPDVAGDNSRGRQPTGFSQAPLAGARG
jgi:heme A synthase